MSTVNNLMMKKRMVNAFLDMCFEKGGISGMGREKSHRQGSRELIFFSHERLEWWKNEREKIGFF